MQRRILALALGLVTLVAPVDATAQRAARGASGPASLSGPLARLFPAETFLYVELRDLGTVAEQMGGADVLYRILEDALGAKGSDGKPAPLPLTMAEFAGVLDSSMAIGVRIPARAAAAASVEPEVFGIVRTPSAGVAAMAKRFVDGSRPPSTAKPTYQTVRGVRVATYAGAKPADAFAYGVTGNDVVFGNPTGVAALLASAGNAPARSLADVPGFASASGRVPPGRQAFVYLNGAPMVRAFHEGIDSELRLTAPDGKPGRVKPEAAALKRFIGADAIGGGSLSALAESGNLTIQAAIEIDTSKPGLVSVLADPPTLSMRAASLVPADTDLFVSTSVDLVRLYDLLISVVTPDVARGLGIPAPPALLADFEANTGLKFRDEFLAAIGTEFALAAVVERTGGLARVAQESAPPPRTPDVVVLVETRDPATLGAAIAKVAGAQGAAPQATTHRETPLWTIGTIGWTVLDGFAVIGEVDDVRACIDAAKSGDSLARAPGYEAVVGTPPNNAISAVYASPRFFEWTAKTAGVTKEAPDAAKAFPSGVFYAIQKDAGGVYANFQVALPNLRMLFEPKRDTEIGRHHAR
jgi:hypothetical protein